MKVLERPNDRGFEVVSPVEKKCVILGETSDRLGIVRGRDELATGLKRLTKSQHKMPNLVQSKIVVGFIPETKHWAIGTVRGKHQRANHEAFLAIGQIFERKA